MTRLILISAVIAAPFAGALTLAERVAELDALPNVTAVETPNYDGVPDPIFPTYTHERITYVYTDSATGTISVNTIPVVVDPSNQCWYVRRPSILPLEVKYITDRTGGGFTEAQVKAQIQAIWADAAPTAGAIINLSVAPVDGKTVRVTGSFDAGNGARELRTYLLWLADADGSVTPGNANIKWERETVAQ